MLTHFPVLIAASSDNKQHRRLSSPSYFVHSSARCTVMGHFSISSWEALTARMLNITGKSWVYEMNLVEVLMLQVGAGVRS